MLDELFAKMSDNELLETYNRSLKANKEYEKQFVFSSRRIISMEIELNKRQLKHDIGFIE